MLDKSQNFVNNHQLELFRHFFRYTGNFLNFLKEKVNNIEMLQFSQMTAKNRPKQLERETKTAPNSAVNGAAWLLQIYELDSLAKPKSLGFNLLIQII